MRWIFKYLPKRLSVVAAVAAGGLVLLLCFLLISSKSGNPPAIKNPPEPVVRENRMYDPDNAPLPKQPAAHVVHKIETNQPVVFLTMDDGQHKNNKAIEYLKQRQWPVSLFLADIYARENYGYFRQIAQNGATIQNHTQTHHFLTDMSYVEQKNEICAASNKINQIYGKRPNLLRPPGGYYDYNTLGAAYECGINAVVMWSAKVDGGNVQFQRGDRLVPGDIVLMHFRPKIMEDLAAFEAEIIKQGLYVARLEDWIRIAP